MRIFFTILFLGFSAISSSIDYYVSSSGNDAASGLSSTTPWKTIAKVNSSFSIFNPGDRILFKRGDTFYGTIRITKSGLAGNAITIGAYGSGNRPVITGFTTVTAWTSMGNGIYSVPLTAESRSNMLTIDNVQYGMGRYPNTGYLIYETHVTNVSITDNELPSAPNWTGAEAVIKKTNFVLDRCKITSHSGQTLTYTSLGTTESATDKYGYFIQNSLGTLDAFGEWYYDGSRLYVYFGSEVPANHVVNVSSVNNLVYNNGYNYINIENISFQGANTSPIYFEGADHCSIKYCTMDFSGENGIYAGSNLYVSIDNNSINHSNRAGIYCKGGNHATITNNTINNSGLIPGGAFSSTQNDGIYLSYNDDCLIQYNNINSSGYNGINFSGNRVVVKNNLIDYSCLLLNDGGGIYTANLFTDRIIEGNIVLNALGNTDGTNRPTAYYAEGIFVDSKATDVEVKNNTTAHCLRSGIFFHESHDNLCTGNTSFNNLNQIRFQSDRVIDYVKNITLRNNIMIAKTATQLAVWARSSIEDIPDFVIADSNYYARPIDDDDVFYTQTPATGVQYRTLAGWQAYVNEDLHSKKSPVAITSLDNIRFEYNASKTNKVITLEKPMIDVKGNKYASSITLLPYSSAVLMVDPNPPVIPVYTGSAIQNATPSLLEMTYNVSLANIVPATSTFSVLVNSIARPVNTVAISGAKVLLTLSSPVVYGDVVTVSYTKPLVNPIQSLSGGQAVSVSAQPVSNNVGPTGPQCVSSVIDTYPSLLFMTFDATLANIIPETSSFTVMVNSVLRPVKSVSVSGVTVQLNLAYGVTPGDVITLAYTKPSTNPLQSPSGTQVASFTARPVINKLIPLTYISSAIYDAAPNILEMTYDQTLSSIVPAVSAFTVIVNSVNRTVSTVSTSGSKVLLTLATPVIYGDVVTVAYTKASTNPIMTIFGVKAESISAQPVSNNVSSPGPQCISSVIDPYPSILFMTFSSTLANIVPATTSFTVMVNSVVRSVKSVTISGVTVQLFLAYGVLPGDVVTLSYTRPSTNPLQSVSGLQVSSFSARPVTNNIKPLVYVSSSIYDASPGVLEINYDNEIANIVPAASAFTVMVNSVSRTVNSVGISGTKVLLTLSTPVVYGDVVTVAYSKPTTNPLQTIYGIQSESISAQPVSNNVNFAGPQYLSSVIETYPSILVMTFDAALANIIPATTSFTVMVNSVLRSVKSVIISGSSVQLYLAYGVSPGDIVTVSYTKPSTNPLQSSDGFQAASFSAKPVTNNIYPLLYISSAINDAAPGILEMTYDYSLANVVPSVSAFTVLVNSVSRTVSSVAISGTRVLLTLASPVVNGEVVTVSYTRPSTNPIQTPYGIKAESISSQPVTNNVNFSGPLYISSVIETYPSILVMTYNQTLANIVPAASSFTVVVNSELRSVKSVTISGVNVQLYLAYGVAPGDIVSLSYTKPSTNPIQSVSGIQAWSFSNQSVNNNIDPLLYVNSIINDATPGILEMNYDLSLANVIPATSAFTVKVNSVTRTVSSVAISGNRVLLTLSSPVISGDLVTVAYTKPLTNPLQTPYGVKAESISAQPVTNSVGAVKKSATVQNAEYSQLMKDNISIYPNPASEYIHISLTEPIDGFQFIYVYDYSGRLCMKNRIESGITDIQIPLDLNPGIYFVKVTQGPKTIHTQKLLLID